MVHILLLILKIIGWILLLILGILVLSVCIVLLTPVRYEGKAEASGDWRLAEGWFQFRWLFSLLRGKVTLQGGRIDWVFWLAWKKFSGESKEEPEHAGEAETAESSGKEPVKEKKAEEPEKAEEAGKASGRDKAEESVKKVSQNDAEAPGKKGAKGDEAKARASGSEESGPAFFEKLKKKLLSLQRGIKRLLSNLSKLLEKKETLTEFLADEAHQAGFLRGITEIKRLIGALHPQKLEAEIEFGFTDPSITGRVLALLSMIYPFLGEHVEFIPDFEQAVLKGNLWIKGKIRFLHFISLIWNMVWDKNVRKTFIHIKNLKEQLF